MANGPSASGARLQDGPNTMAVSPSNLVLDYINTVPLGLAAHGAWRGERCWRWPVGVVFRRYKITSAGGPWRSEEGQFAGGRRSLASGVGVDDCPSGRPS